MGGNWRKKADRDLPAIFAALALDAAGPCRHDQPRRGTISALVPFSPLAMLP
jgi:hypothetical protein